MKSFDSVANASSLNSGCSGYDKSFRLIVDLFSAVCANFSKAMSENSMTSFGVSSVIFFSKYESVASVRIAIEHGPANFSAKHPRMTQRFRSHGIVVVVSDLIISATSITESFDGNGESSRSRVITDGPIG